MEKEIILGKKYEVKPARFHRNMVGTAQAITNGGIIFHIEHCELCDQETANAHNREVTANYADVKQMVGETYFFS
ncbi:hypothetical protein P7G51_04895 [Enterococcus asini]|uniref:hypothetical protein n=1 Tax=Enterococcus TaxID=1350 RepID=UPI00289222A9|nr:hypothetical protein [Enterococcus asini]MDT2756708.1 hypothetical protein [Enterococcus asini]